MGKVTLRSLLFILAAISALMLASAHGFERFGGMTPCLLCLKQREAWWAVLGFSLLGAACGHIWAPAKRIAVGVCVLALAAGAALAGYHAGAEWQWWPGPAACAAGGAITITDLDLNTALSVAAKRPSCTDVPWSLFGISMAGWNAILSFAVMVASIKGLIHDLSST